MTPELSDLPVELIQHIALHLDATDIWNLSRSNQHFQGIFSNDDKFLLKAAKKMLGFPVISLDPDNSMGCYLMLFKFRKHINKTFFNKSTYSEHTEKNRTFLQIIFNNKSYCIEGYMCSVWGLKNYHETLETKFFKQLLFSVRLEGPYTSLKKTVYQVQDFCISEECDNCGGYISGIFNKEMKEINNVDEHCVLSFEFRFPYPGPQVKIEYLDYEHNEDWSKRKKRKKDALRYATVRNDATGVDCSYPPDIVKVYESQTVMELLRPGIFCGFPYRPSIYKRNNGCKCGYCDYLELYQLAPYNVEHFRRIYKGEDSRYYVLESPDFEVCQTGARLKIILPDGEFPSCIKSELFSLSHIGDPECEFSPDCIPKYCKYIKDDENYKSLWFWRTGVDYHGAPERYLQTYPCKMIIFDQKTVGYVPLRDEELFLLTRVDDLINKAV